MSLARLTNQKTGKRAQKKRLFEKFICRGDSIPTVCIDCRYVSDRPSGIAQVVRQLVAFAPDLAPEIDFHLLTHPKRTGDLSKAANVTHRDVSIGPNHPATMWLLPETARIGSSDLFHATYNTLPARVAVRSLVTVHDIMWLTHPQWCDDTLYGRLKRHYFGNGIRRALSKADHIATVSAATRRAILEHNPALESRVSVTRSGVSEQFRPLSADPPILARFGLKEGQPYILVVGQSAPYKNHANALKGFAQGVGDKEDAIIIFVQRQGTGARLLARLAQELEISGRLRLTGGVSDDELLHLYAGASALLHPSLCEGFGNPLAEAMACGCPVITSNYGAMSEVTGSASVLVDPRDPAGIGKAVREIWHDQAKADAMRQAGLERAKELKWRDFAQANVDIYRQLLA